MPFTRGLKEEKISANFLFSWFIVGPVKDSIKIAECIELTSDVISGREVVNAGLKKPTNGYGYTAWIKLNTVKL